MTAIRFTDAAMSATLLHKMIDNPLGFAEFGLDRQVPDWAPMNWDMPVLHLGPGEKHIPGTDEFDWPEWDFDRLTLDNIPSFWVNYNTRTGSGERLPYYDGEAGGIIATHVLEHLNDPRPLLREASRILAPGCPFNILVPHGESLMFKQDLDHKTAFVIETWKTLLSNPYYTKEHDGFAFEVGGNFLFGVKESNLALVTQLIRR